MKVNRLMKKVTVTMIVLGAMCELLSNKMVVMAAEEAQNSQKYMIEADSSNEAIEELEKAKKNYAQEVEITFTSEGLCQEVITYDRNRVSDFGYCSYRDYRYSHGRKEYTYSKKYVKVSYDINATEETLVDSYIAQTVASLRGETDYETVCKVHDYICNLITYDIDTLEGRADNYDAYDAIFLGKAVCSGYAQVFQKYMEAMNIESYIVSSKEFNHAWNIVKIAGEWYHLDCTWDDPDNKLSRTYFLLGSEGLKRTKAQHYESVGNIVLARNNYN